MADRVALERATGDIARHIVSPEAVVEHGARVLRRIDQPAEASSAVASSIVVSISSAARSLLAPPRGEQHRGMGDRRVPRRVGDQAILVDQSRRRTQLPSQEVGDNEEGQRELEVHERAHVASDLRPA